ncbi:heterokaryon incompatibility protein-domain-containing protein [Tricladium varicosporioides]|nr:heterokaryon incompatibility protein-domain-containing protein [Hymenoscyphus varicosporioides]
MYCFACLEIRAEDILSGKPYKHLALGELRSSAANGCPVCAFLLQHILPALRRPLGPGEVLQIFLEQHSSQYRFKREEASSNREEVRRLNDEDDRFREAGIAAQSGYFSKLIAVVARPELPPPVEATVEERELCYVALEFCTESGEGEGIFEENVARLVRQDPCDPKCYEMVSSWVKTCWEGHDCEPKTDTLLPTRVLEIGRIGEPNLRLIISNGRKGRYVALSHCWGKRPTTTTTIQNIARHLESIVLDALPANFRDAVMISRELGYDYLWIDSLCIIQGDRDDWVTESSLMGQVYQNCAVMLAASGASDSYGGMLNLRAESCALPNSKLFLAPKRRPNQDLEDSELGSRAWTSQERILAPRIIYYSGEQILWECRSDRRAEATIRTLFDTYQSYNKRYHDRLDARILDQDEEETEGEDQDKVNEIVLRPEGWFWAIQGYSRRHLTNPTDKLPALSGLAQNVFHPRRATGGRYLAGLWSNDILRQLLWENGEDRVASFCEANYVSASSLRYITKLSKAKAYRAPSWSWVAYDGPIKNDRGNDFVIPQKEEDVENWNRSQRLNLRVIDIDIRLASKDPFGQVQEGSNIVVEGMCQYVAFKPGYRTIFADGQVECLWNFDVREMGDVERKYLCLQAGRKRGTLRQGKEGNPEDLIKYRLEEIGIRCLVLLEANGTEMWERVGVLTFDVDGESDSGWEKRTLTLI